MVYFGPSRGCATCKRRRKKCDETRPSLDKSCMRCVTAKRTCGGYENDEKLVIQQYERPDHNKPGSTTKSIGRKCSLPVRGQLPGTSILANDDSPIEVPDQAVDEFALQAFVYDFCVSSSNKALSRGFLGRLEPRLHRLGWKSNLAKACGLVAFAKHGISLNRPHLTLRAEKLYQDLVASLAVDIQHPPATLANKEDKVLVALLLGLYEVIAADDLRPSNHNVHASGVAAMLWVRNSPLHLLQAVQDGQSLGALGGAVLNTGLLTPPIANSPAQALDSLLSVLGSIWEQSNGKINTDTEILALRDEAMRLNVKFSQWEEAQPNDFKPSTVGSMTGRGVFFDYGVGSWPGKVDTYFDFYVAGVWNVYRAARLLLIDLILQLSGIIDDGKDHDAELDVVLHVLEDMLSSIPYHLAEDVHVFLRDSDSNSSIVNPGRSVGGLLLMHSMHVVSNLLVINPQIRSYMKKCLVWMKQNMGIGLASLLAKSSAPEPDSFAGSSMLVLVGLLA